MSESQKDYIKQRTIELYDQLPSEEVERRSRIDIRDQVLQLNYTFFGYVASHTFINNSSITYDDKFQSAVCAFLTCWYKFRWEGHYRTDLSFAVFFKPRIGEMIERELNEVKYSIRRSLCMEAGAQLGKHWAKVRYEDLNKVNLPVEKMNALKAIFGTMYWADLEQHEMFLHAPVERVSEFDNLTDKYDTIEELLIHEMIEEETSLSDQHLKKMSQIYGLPYEDLQAAYPKARETLYKRLHEKLDLQMQ